MSIMSRFLRNKNESTKTNLKLIELEAREVPSVTIADITDQDIFTDRPLFVPVTVTNTPNGTVTTGVTSDDPNLKAEILTGGRSVRFNISAADKDGVAFTGALTIRLFEDIAPLATGTIVSLVESGFYNDKLFHRIIQDFVIQGGSKNGDGIGGSGTLPDVADEFNREYTFASSGIVAMANATDDNNNSQFFITDIDLPISKRTNFLNFNHSIVGQLTEGFDIYSKIIATPTNSSDRPNSPVTITSATLFTDNENAIIKLTPATGWDKTAKISVSANDGSATAATDSFNLTGLTYTGNDNAFLNPVANPTTNTNVPYTIQLTGVDINNNAIQYGLVPLSSDPNASKVTVNINSTTGVANITPAAGFTGTVQLRATAGDPTASAAPDSQIVTLTVNSSAAPTSTAVTIAVGTGTNKFDLTAGVTGPTTSVGNVEFFSGSKSIGTSVLTNNLATLNYTPTSSSESITAKYTSTNADIGNSTSPAVTLNSTISVVNTVTLSKSSSGQNRAVQLTSKLTNVTDARGKVEFYSGTTLVGTTNVYDNQATVFYVPTVVGNEQITSKFYQGTSSASVESLVATLTVTADTGVRDISTVRISANNTITAVDFSNKDIFSVSEVFERSFTGQLETRVADLNGDGQEDIVVVPAAQSGGGPIMVLIDGATGNIATRKVIFEDTFRGGLNIDVADFKGVGYSQVLVGAGQLGGPRVTVWDFKTSAEVVNYFAYDSTLRGGVTVDAADLRGNGYFVIITGAGQGGGPVIAVWDGIKTNTQNGSSSLIPTRYGQAFAGDQNNRAGIRVVAGAPKANRTSDIRYGAQTASETGLDQLLDPFAAGIFVN